ncbi:17536_t:CDS:2 [Acaulospora colombiana]|uniref:17536_t:CDS:1 n=1 Tax=Acaulospora colombiana TaxID=27376 RepID=A0ACA9L2X2_9GLOM|nr:17536_t:CDS:2 [Acaulospora colombiana]
MTKRYLLPSYLKDSPVEEYNKKTFPPLPLPTHWNSADGDSYISISDDDKLSLQYTGKNFYQLIFYSIDGRAKSWIDAASIRSDNYIPPEVGLYYFEITVIDCGHRGCIGIGLSKPGTRLNRMPGWEPDTIGYHGDDGHLYYERGTGRKFGPLYTTGETVGCGINYYDKEVFFTKNGVSLGVASKDKFDSEMYPTCGMESPKESAIVNFGTRPFVFDINTYAKNIFAKAKQREKEKKEVSAEVANENNDGVTEVAANATEEGQIDNAAVEIVTDGNAIQQSDTIPPLDTNNATAIVTAIPTDDNVTDVNNIVPTVSDMVDTSAVPTSNDVADGNTDHETIAIPTNVVLSCTRSGRDNAVANITPPTTAVENPALEPDPIHPSIDETIISSDIMAERLHEIFTVSTEGAPNVVDIITSNSVNLIEALLPSDVVTVNEDNDTAQNTIDVLLYS